jgi:hypothetical protein
LQRLISDPQLPPELEFDTDTVLRSGAPPTTAI